MEIAHTSTNRLFDVVTGKQSIGDAAIEATYESGVDPRDLMPLTEVILDQSISLYTENYDPIRYQEKTSDDFIRYGQWLSNLLETVRPDIIISREILLRASAMRIGRTPTYIVTRFNNRLWEFRQDAGLRMEREIGRFDSWTTRDYVIYAKRVADGMHRKPTKADFDRWWKKRQFGPSGSHVTEKFPGGIRGLNERIGYPDVDSWELDDYIDFGVRFMRANPGVQITARRLDYLSKLKRGPCASGITLKFKDLSLADYKAMVEERFEVSESKKAEFENTLIHALKKRAEFDPALARRLEIIGDDYEAVVKFGARYLVACSLIPDADEGGRLQVAKIVDGDAFARNIHRINPSSTPAVVEAKADHLGLFDYIWPFDDYMRYLKLPYEMCHRKNASQKKK